MIERFADIGGMNTFIVHPERGGPHPAILFYMDAPGIREELRDMARRLASAGYYVMLPNLYHRAGVEEIGNFIGEEGTATRKKMFALMGSLSIALVMEDTDALIACANADPAASKGPIGTVGYCTHRPLRRSGPFRAERRHRRPLPLQGRRGGHAVLLSDPRDADQRAHGPVPFAGAGADAAASAAAQARAIGGTGRRFSGGCPSV